jgi:hypothetical protein
VSALGFLDGVSIASCSIEDVAGLGGAIVEAIGL